MKFIINLGVSKCRVNCEELFCLYFICLKLIIEIIEIKRNRVIYERGMLFCYYGVCFVINKLFNIIVDIKGIY